MKFVLVKGLIKGKAAKHIFPRLREDAINLYNIV
jgi:hypothetical protein